MACDNLYCAYLKAHYPYEFYATILQLYDEKGNKDKIAQIIDEMKRYRNIDIKPGMFGEDNRGWYINKEDHSISQSLSSIKFMSKSITNELYEAGQKHFDTFTDLLRYLQMHTHIDTRQIEILIMINYFKRFGETGKLHHIYRAFFDGTDDYKKITKILVEKTVAERMKQIKEYESSLPNKRMHPLYRLRAEYENIGMCFTKEPSLKTDCYFIFDVDAKYGVKATIYNIRNGLIGKVRIKKPVYEADHIESGDMITGVSISDKPKFRMVGGKFTAVKGERELWLDKYNVVSIL